MDSLISFVTAGILAKALLVIGIIGLLQHLIALRCTSMMNAWAKEGGWRIVRQRRSFLGTSGLGIKPGLPIYLLTLENSIGRQRKAYVRCGHEVMSVLSDEIAVQWVDQASKVSTR